MSSLKGGVGKSSVTLGLASAALHAGIPTLVIDLDPHADASTALGVHAPRGLDIGTMLRKPKKGAVTGIAVPSRWTEHPISPKTTSPDQPAAVLDVAPGSASTSPLDRAEFKPKDLKRLRTVLHGITTYELVLIDCPPSLSALTRMAWAASDKILSVAEPSLFSVAGTKRTLTALAQLEHAPGAAAPTAGVVINRASTGSPEHKHRLAELHELFGALVVDPALPEAPVLQQVQGAAWPVHRWPGEQAADLAARFSSILGGLMENASPAS